MFNCACVYEFREVRIRGARCFYFVGALLFRDNVQTHLGGASIREGASNRDITVCNNSMQCLKVESLWHTVLSNKWEVTHVLMM